nr:MAG TPA: hypothetical protein [Caudoviricetes sp.]
MRETSSITRVSSKSYTQKAKISYISYPVKDI